MSKALRDLTDLQLLILAVLWEHGELTASDVHARLEKRTGLARKTIGTLLHRLEKQGILTYRAEGREYSYSAAVSREAVRKARMKGLLGSLFQGDFAAMVSFAVERGEVSQEELTELRAIVDAASPARKR